MKIVVAVKQVPDTATQTRISADSRRIDTAGITWIVSPYDEFALEEALRIRERMGTGRVVAVTVGPDRAKEALRSCLAMGADEAVHVNEILEENETLPAARVLAAVVEREAAALALFGRQAIDDDMGSVPAQVAELLGWPSVAWVTKVTVGQDGRSVRVERQVEGGVESIDVPIPCVLSAQKGLNEPRYPSLKGLMGAKRKEIKELKAADVGVSIGDRALQVIALESLPTRPPGRIIAGEPAMAVEELVRLLREEAKAI